MNIDITTVDGMQTLNFVVADLKKKIEYKNLGDHINIVDDRYCCNVLPK